jgi:hypothetical protein
MTTRKDVLRDIAPVRRYKTAESIEMVAASDYDALLRRLASTRELHRPTGYHANCRTCSCPETPTREEDE